MRPKNRLMFPAKGTVLYFDFWVNIRCSIKEKIRENMNNTIKTMDENDIAKAKNIRISPIAIASLNFNFNLNRAYR